jgi:hypothetical protein
VILAERSVPGAARQNGGLSLLSLNRQW